MSSKTCDKIKSIISIMREAQATNSKNIRDIDFMDFYNDIYALVVHSKGEILYKEITNFFYEYVKTLFINIKNQNDQTVPKNTIIHQLNAIWTTYLNLVNNLSPFFLYMDNRYCVKEKQSPLKFNNLALKIFREELNNSPEILKISSNELLNQCLLPTPDKPLIKEFIEMLCQLSTPKLNIYENVFELKFLTAVKTRYEDMFERFYNSLSLRDFITKAVSVTEKFMKSETILKKSTSKKVMKIIKNDILDEIALKIMSDQVKSNELLNLMENEDYKVISKFSSLVQKGRNSSFYKVIRKFTDLQMNESALYSAEIGDQFDFQKITIYFDKIVENQSKIDKMLELTNLRLSWGKLNVSSDKNFLPFLSFYLDRLITLSMITTSKKFNEYKVGILLLINDDMKSLEELLLVYLEKRIISVNICKMALEKRFFNDSKIYLGKSCAEKMKSMINDIDEKHFFEYKFKGISVMCRMYKAKIWPFYYRTENDIIWPEFINKVFMWIGKEYNQFMDKKRLRLLKFVPHYNKCKITIEMNKVKINVIANGFQTIIINLFNEYEKITLTKIKSLTGINDIILTETIKTLTTKPNNLLKNHKNVFELNKTFHGRIFEKKDKTINLIKKEFYDDGIKKVLEKYYTECNKKIK